MNADKGPHYLYRVVDKSSQFFAQVFSKRTGEGDIEYVRGDLVTGRVRAAKTEVAGGAITTRPKLILALLLIAFLSSTLTAIIVSQSIPAPCLEDVASPESKLNDGQFPIRQREEKVKK